MNLFKKKTASESEGRETGKGGNNKVALLVLLVLLGAFGYLYFFTSLIVPHEVPPPPAPAPVPQVKQSMPPRPADTAAAAPAAGAQPPQTPGQAPNAAGTAPAAPAAPGAPAPAAKPAPAAPPQPAAPPAKPAAAPAPKKEEPKPAAPPATPAAPKKAEPQPVKPAGKPEPVKAPAAKDKQPAAPQPAAAKGKVAVPAVASEKAKKPAKTYTIFAGDVPAGEEAAAVAAKLVKANIKPVVKHENKKARKMNRLYFGTFGDFDEYTAALEKLKQSVRGAFAVEKDGRYSVYAGSFGSVQSAEKEKKMLAAKGIKVDLQQVTLPLSTVRITAGSFKSRADADRAAARLKKQGVAASVIPKGK